MFPCAFQASAEYEIAIKNRYGRLRDTYERLVERYIFCDVIRRGVDRIATPEGSGDVDLRVECWALVA